MKFLFKKKYDFCNESHKKKVFLQTHARYFLETRQVVAKFTISKVLETGDSVQLKQGKSKLFF